MQQFIPNFTATLKLLDNTFEQLPLRQDDASSGRLLSLWTDPLTKAGSYEVTKTAVLVPAATLSCYINVIDNVATCHDAAHI